jgi:hypothetical protein
MKRTLNFFFFGKIIMGAFLTITAAARIFIIMPSTANPATLLEDNKVVTFVAFDEIDRHTNTLGHSND